MLADSINPDDLPKHLQQRLKTWRHTQSICEQLPKPSPSVKYHLQNVQCERRFPKTQVNVLDIDSLVAAQAMLSSSTNRPAKVAVLNLADDSSPLGYPDFSAAQEESLARKSTLMLHLDMKMYPIKDTSGIYSKNVAVFKDVEDNDYAIIKPFCVDVLTVPGVRHPNLTEDGHMHAEDIKRLDDKIRLMYEMAYLNNIDRLILGASSCGAWRANPEDVAEAFRKVGSEFDGVCEQVVFAVMRPTAGMLFGHREPDAKCNYETFKRILESNVSSI